MNKRFYGGINMKVTFAGTEMTLGGTDVKVGERAPVFKAVKNDLTEFDSASLWGKKIVYSVVPSIDTKVCSIQTHEFNDAVTKLGDDVVVVTISADLPFAQARYCANEGIDNTMIVSDYRNHDFGEKYGFVLNELNLLGRGVVVVNRLGTIAYIERVPEITDEVNYEAAYEAVKQLV